MVLSRQIKLSFCLLLCIATLLSLMTLGPFVSKGGVTKDSHLLRTVHALEDRIEQLQSRFGSHVKSTAESDSPAVKTYNFSSIKAQLLRNTAGGYGSCSNDGRNVGKVFRKDTYVYFTDKFKLDKMPVSSWIEPNKRIEFCGGQMAMYDNRFGLLHDVVLHPDKRIGAAGQSKGGEMVKDVLNQQLNKEDYKFGKGFYELLCRTGEQFKTVSSYKWIPALEVTTKKSEDIPAGEMEVENKYAIVIARGDYANMHNWARNLYNTFLLMSYFKIQPQNITVLFLDGHPFTSLDYTWEALFGPPVRVGHMEKPVLYKNLIWGLMETDGPVTDYKTPNTPYLEEYRAFVLNQNNLDDTSVLNCKRLKITLMIRRNAVYHPRNIAGNVGRKIFNEAEVIGALMAEFPDACVQGVLMESLPMKNQLEIISQTDILVGMHGAGMSHTLFLPQHAGILELFPKDFKKGRPWYRCYQSVAEWRTLKYETWENFDVKIEMPHDFTILPSDIVVNKVKTLAQQLC